MSDRPPFEIRHATVQDAELLAELGARLFEQTFGASNSPEDMRAYLAIAFSPELQTEEIGDPERVVFIAEAAGGPIGYAMLRRGSRVNGVIADRPVEIQRIYVDSAWHGQRVGNALMERCVAQARAWAGDVLWLGVWQTNLRAIRFYERSGFVTVGEQTFMLGNDPQQDFVMARPLS